MRDQNPTRFMKSLLFQPGLRWGSGLLFRSCAVGGRVGTPRTLPSRAHPRAPRREVREDLRAPRRAVGVDVGVLEVFLRTGCPPRMGNKWQSKILEGWNRHTCTYSVCVGSLLDDVGSTKKEKQIFQAILFARASPSPQSPGRSWPWAIPGTAKGCRTTACQRLAYNDQKVSKGQI